MTQSHFNRSNLSKIMSWHAYQRLEKWTLKQQAGIPYPLSVKAYFHVAPGRFYLSKQLEAIIIKLINKGTQGRAMKVKNAGRYIDKSKVVTDVIGRDRKIGSGEWVKDKDIQIGASDIRIELPGIVWNCEIKIGKDKQGANQKLFEQQSILLGQHYSIVKTLDDFFEQYEKLSIS